MDSSLLTVHYTPTDGHEWALYFQQKLAEYKVQCKLNNFTADFKHQIRSVNVNIFFLTPDFLEYKNWSLMRVMEKHSTMLVLTGIDHEDLEDASVRHNCKEMLDYYIYSLYNTEESVRDLLISAIALFEDNSHSHSHSVLHESHSEPANYKPIIPSSNQDDDDDSDQYDTLPTRTRQVNDIKEVFYKDGTLYVLLLRKAESNLHVDIGGQQFSPQHTDYAVYELPYTGTDQVSLTVLHDSYTIGKREVDIKMADQAGQDHKQSERPHCTEQCERPTKPHVRETVNMGTQTDNVHQDDHTILRDKEVKFSLQETERESDYMNIKDVVRPDSTSDNTSNSDDTSTNKSKLDIIRELLESETDPLEMLCQCLGIDKDAQQLDEKMSDMVKSVETLRQLTYIGRPHSDLDETTSTWPTLVHFGAQFNLMSFCDLLLSNPLMFRACLQPNKEGHMPHDIAMLHGHHDLSEHLRHFSKYVSAETERDSGISIRTSTPRLSTISQHPPPVPHKMSDDGYIRMSKELHDEALYDNDLHGIRGTRSHMSKHGVHTERYSGSYDDSVDEDDLYMDMSSVRDSSSVKSIALDHQYHQTHTETIKETEPIDIKQPADREFVERRTIELRHDDADIDSEAEVEYHRKDVVSMLGITPAPKKQEQLSPNSFDRKERKKGLFSAMFSKTKQRSKSESAFNPELLPVVNLQRSHIKKRCDSERSSATSSTASTYSNSSLNDDQKVEVREKKKKPKNKIKGLLTRAKKSDSMRISHAIGDQHLQAPKLPPRKRYTVDEMF